MFIGPLAQETVAAMTATLIAILVVTTLCLFAVPLLPHNAVALDNSIQLREG